jgi:hypothetical protein
MSTYFLDIRFISFCNSSGFSSSVHVTKITGQIKAVIITDGVLQTSVHFDSMNIITYPKSSHPYIISISGFTSLHYILPGPKPMELKRFLRPLRHGLASLLSFKPELFGNDPVQVFKST